MTADDTTPQTSADVIEAAAKAMRECWLADDPHSEWESLSAHARRAYIEATERYAAGGWLADPAERDELEDLREEVAWRRDASKEYGRIADQYEADLRTLRVDLATAERISGDIEARAERAEAEVARLTAQMDRVRALHKPHECVDWRTCQIIFGGRCAREGMCSECRYGVPCPTTCALDGGAS